MGAFLSEPVAAIVVERASTDCWATASASMQGWRKNHEDAHVQAVAAGGAAGRAAVFAVLDGHGGQACAHIGQALLQEHLEAFARQGTVPQEVAEKELVDAFVEVDARCREQLAEDRSGSTVVSAIITQTQPHDFCVQLAHAGDSRAVLCVGGGERLVCTSDHKPNREDEQQRIEAAGGTVAQGPLGGGPMRVDGALAVSRSLGDFHFKPAGRSPATCKVTAVPEVQTVMHCVPGDWLLLACDGVFDVMENEEVYHFITSRLGGSPMGSIDGGVVVTELLHHVLEKGSKDNCTALLVQLLEGNGSAAEAPVAQSRELLQGPWRKAPPEIQSKYADWFADQGFEAEASMVRSGAGAARASTGSTASAGGDGAGGAAPAPQATALVKALQAMRSAGRTSRSSSS